MRLEPTFVLLIFILELNFYGKQTWTNDHICTNCIKGHIRWHARYVPKNRSKRCTIWWTKKGWKPLPKTDQTYTYKVQWIILYVTLFSTTYFIVFCLFVCLPLKISQYLKSQTIIFMNPNMSQPNVAVWQLTREKGFERKRKFLYLKTMKIKHLHKQKKGIKMWI